MNHLIKQEILTGEYIVSSSRLSRIGDSIHVHTMIDFGDDRAFKNKEGEEIVQEPLSLMATLRLPGNVKVSVGDKVVVSVEVVRNEK